MCSLIKPLPDTRCDSEKGFSYDPKASVQEPQPNKSERPVLT